MALGFGLKLSSRNRSRLGVNLLDGLSWTQGTTTTMTDEGAFIRCARNGGTCRIYKQVANLEVGQTYRLLGTVYRRTSNASVWCRVADTSAIGQDGPYFEAFIASPHQNINKTFVADATTYFIGFLAAITTTNGLYFEVDKNFGLYHVPT